MAGQDWSLPGLASLYTAVLTILKGRDVDALTLCVDLPTNLPTGAIRYLRASDKFQEWDGAVWNDKVISIAGGGTGAATAANARTALGLGTIAVQNSNNVTITGGVITGVPLVATALTGLVPTASLGSGAANSGTWLRGDQSWQAIPAGTPTGVISMYGAAVAPADWLLCDGSAVSRATYAALFAVVSTTFGVGDGSTTFNLPDLRQRFPLGKAASGTGSTLGSTGGAIDHTHTGAAHTHTVAGHTHTGPSHTHTISSDGSHSHAFGTTTDAGGSHSHTYSGTTTGPSDAQDGDTVIPSLSVTNVHTHNYSGTTSTDGSHTHTLAGNTDTQGAHTHGGVTGASGTGATGSTALTTDSTTPGASGSNNPPYQVVNYIIHT